MDVITAHKESIKPKRKYRKKQNLSISQRRNYKKYIPAQLTPTVEFKSQRQLRFEKCHGLASGMASHSFQFSVPSEVREKCLATSATPSLPHSSTDDAETNYYSDGIVSSTPSSYVQACIRELANSNTLTKVLHKCEEHGVTRHFIALIKEIASGHLHVTG